MTNATINKNLEESAKEMQKLITQSKRKLLEFDVLMSLSEIRRGQSTTYQTPEDLIKDL